MQTLEKLTLPEAILRAQQLVQQGTPESLSDARILCLKVLGIDSGNTNALFLLGTLDFNTRNFVSALQFIERAIELNQQVSVLWNLLGRTLLELQRYGDAEQAFRKALALQPEHTEFVLNLANALNEQRHFTEAIEVCADVSPLDLDSFRVLAIRARAYTELGFLGEAISVCREACEANPNDAKSHYNLAVALQKLGMVREVEQALRTTIDIQPDFAQAHVNLAHLLGGQGRTEDAISHLQALLRLDSKKFADVPRQITSANRWLALEKRAIETSQHLRPVFLLAPVARCGSTFVQRLFNSSNRFIMFGENENISRRLPACVNYAISKAGLEQDISELGDLGEFLTKGWVAGLFPGRGVKYLESTLKNFYDAVEHYQQSAQKLEREWGIKEPHAGELKTLRRLLPYARFIFIYRNLLDVARSYKTRGWLGSSFDTMRLAHDWQEEIRKMFLCGSKNVLIVKYEDLVVQPEQELSRIEEFAGISGIDRKLMECKVNLFEHDEHGRTVSGYRPPRELTTEEQDILLSYAREMLIHLGYTNTLQK